MNDPKTEANPGDILYSKKNTNNLRIPTHYLIYIGPGENEDVFDGAMLTTSTDPKFGNIPLLPGHIQEHDVTGKRFRFQFKDSLFSPERYHKKNSWAPFNKQGELTPEGLDFVLEHLSDDAKFFPHNSE